MEIAIIDIVDWRMNVTHNKFVFSYFLHTSILYNCWHRKIAFIVRIMATKFVYFKFPKLWHHLFVNKILTGYFCNSVEWLTTVHRSGPSVSWSLGILRICDQNTASLWLAGQILLCVCKNKIVSSAIVSTTSICSNVAVKFQYSKKLVDKILVTPKTNIPAIEQESYRVAFIYRFV